MRCPSWTGEGIVQRKLIVLKRSTLEACKLSEDPPPTTWTLRRFQNATSPWDWTPLREYLIQHEFPSWDEEQKKSVEIFFTSDKIRQMPVSDVPPVMGTAFDYTQRFQDFFLLHQFATGDFQSWTVWRLNIARWPQGNLRLRRTHPPQGSQQPLRLFPICCPDIFKEFISTCYHEFCQSVRVRWL